MIGSIVGGALAGAGSLIGAGINAGMQDKVNKENAKLQKEFAQNSIQWKVADAKKAGLHPLVALGAQTYNASPSSVSSNSGDGLANAMGHLGGAVSSYYKEKMNADSEMDALKLENQRLENDKLRQEIAKMGQGIFSITPDKGNQLLSVDNSGKELVPISKAIVPDIGFSLTPAPRGGYYFQFKNGSTDASSMEEGNLLGKGIGYFKLKDEIHFAIERLEAQARKEGLLKKDEYFDVGEFDGTGFHLKPRKGKSFSRRMRDAGKDTSFKDVIKAYIKPWKKLYNYFTR